MPRTLEGLKVLVTRPAAQADGLCRELAAHGAVALRFPLIRIEDRSMDAACVAPLATLARGDLLVFVSANAVQSGCAALAAAGGIPAGVRVACVGPATAAVLEQHGVTVDVMPDRRADSEALLAALARDSDRPPRRALIVRGNGGREHLAQSLRDSGTEVAYAQCYARGCPDTAAELAAQMRSDPPQVLVVTSSEAFRNLARLAGRDTPVWRLPVVVFSERTAGDYRELGGRGEVLQSAAGDAAIVETLRSWRARPR
ncbi:MAG: uroporphyrinogen-III synthase [Gammaproteobacteria bacterium]|jgi:uroporphyrinogen-III synthase|nr:uroporphyrinogen-III synthase [Gammaproteobacteria bacterium]